MRVFLFFFVRISYAAWALSMSSGLLAHGLLCEDQFSMDLQQLQEQLEDGFQAISADYSSSIGKQWVNSSLLTKQTHPLCFIRKGFVWAAPVAFYLRFPLPLC